LTSRSLRHNRVHAIVPVKVLNKSKIRLSPLLSSKERKDLTVVMLKDVLIALSQARLVESVTVVSADRKVRRIANKFGAEFVWEARRRGLNKALTLGIEHVNKRRRAAILIMHADLPFVTCRDVDKFLKLSRDYSVAIGPSKDASGTNALLLERASIIRLAFGKNSYKKHMALARSKHLRCKVIQLEGIAFDIDEPVDLLRLMGSPRSGKTGRFLRNLIR
jgi:2-phospho-L-lactate guanylyltransferase